MIDSILFLNPSQEILIEKHYNGKTPRPNPLPHPPPLLLTPNGAQTHLTRNGLTLLALLQKDTPPLLATTFLSSLADTLHDYFGELNEHAIKDNFVTVYELLDEMLDSGIPLTMERNTLKQLVTPPSMLGRVFEQLGAESPLSKAVQHSMVPWRKGNVSYAQNEIFVDVIESVDVVFDKSRIARMRISGCVQMNCRLSGHPDVSMRLRAAAPFDDVSFHHSVRVPHYASDQIVSFVPPDGAFELMKYAIRDVRGVSLPVEINASIKREDDTVRVSVTVIPRFTPTQSRETNTNAMFKQVLSAAGQLETENVMDSLVVKIPFGDCLAGVSLSANYGTVAYENGFVTWVVGGVARGKTPSLGGNVSLVDGAELGRGIVLVEFRVPGFAASGVCVESLEIGERYKYYKGLKCITRAGLYEIRL